jgi:hypothetical protein
MGRRQASSCVHFICFEANELILLGIWTASPLAAQSTWRAALPLHPNGHGPAEWNAHACIYSSNISGRHDNASCMCSATRVTNHYNTDLVQCMMCGVHSDVRMWISLNVSQHMNLMREVHHGPDCKKTLLTFSDPPATSSDRPFLWSPLSGGLAVKV